MIHLDLKLEVRNSCGFFKSYSYDICVKVCVKLERGRGISVSVVTLVHLCTESTVGEKLQLASVSSDYTLNNGVYVETHLCWFCWD